MDRILRRDAFILNFWLESINMNVNYATYLTTTGAMSPTAQSRAHAGSVSRSSQSTFLPPPLNPYLIAMREDLRIWMRDKSSHCIATILSVFTRRNGVISAILLTKKGRRGSGAAADKDDTDDSDSGSSRTATQIRLPANMTPESSFLLPYAPADAPSSNSGDTSNSSGHSHVAVGYHLLQHHRIVEAAADLGLRLLFLLLQQINHNSPFGHAPQRDVSRARNRSQSQYNSQRSNRVSSNSGLVDTAATISSNTISQWSCEHCHRTSRQYAEYIRRYCAGPLQCTSVIKNALLTVLMTPPHALHMPAAPRIRVDVFGGTVHNAPAWPAFWTALKAGDLALQQNGVSDCTAILVRRQFNCASIIGKHVCRSSLFSYSGMILCVASRCLSSMCRASWLAVLAAALV